MDRDPEVRGRDWFREFRPLQVVLVTNEKEEAEASGAEAKGSDFTVC